MLLHDAHPLGKSRAALVDDLDGARGPPPPILLLQRLRDRAGRTCDGSVHAKCGQGGWMKTIKLGRKAPRLRDTMLRAGCTIVVASSVAGRGAASDTRR